MEAELFRQRKRLADAQRSLREKSTKAALESERIANGKVEWALGKLADLRRHEPIDEDSRIFPLHYAPVMVIENGQPHDQADALRLPAGGQAGQFTTSSSRAPTTRDATASTASGEALSASRTGWS